MVRILFVCLGNICRSPAAEAVFKHKLELAGLSNRVVCDSAGTSGYHSGNKADERMISHAKKRGIEVTSRSRKVDLSDFDKFDLVIAMDQSNESDLVSICNDANLEKIQLMLSFGTTEYLDVPDPYYGGAEGFELVLNLLDESCEGLLNFVKVKYLGE